MAIDPHLTRKSKPLPIQSGWTGRRGIIPHGSFDKNTLQEAVAILQGSSTHYYFNEEGDLAKICASPVPKSSSVSISKKEGEAAFKAMLACDDALEDEEEAHGTDTDRYRKLKAESDRHSAVAYTYHDSLVATQMAEVEKFLDSGEDFSPEARRSLYAVLCMLANAALAYKPALDLESHIELTVHSHQHTNSAEMQDCLDFLRAGVSEETIEANTREETPQEIREWCPLVDRMEGVQECMDAFRDGKSLDSGWPYYDTWEGSKLLQVALGNAKTIQRAWDYDAIWKLHNQCPEAVNFILAAPQAEFLLNQDGTHQPITENLQQFLNSPWMEMAGNIDLRVEPVLLDRTHKMLARESLSPESVLAR